MTFSGLFLGWNYFKSQDNSTTTNKIANNTKIKKQGSPEVKQNENLGFSLERYVTENLLNRAPSSMNEEPSDLSEYLKNDKDEDLAIGEDDFNSQIKDLSESEYREIVLLKKDIEFQETFLKSMKESGETPKNEIEINKQVIIAKKKQFKSLLLKYKFRNDQN